MDPLEEIKSRLPIDQVVSEYTELKKSGRNFKALCPFHNEKTPSFIVSPDKGIAYCFGCQNGGDIFKFIQLVEHVDFAQSMNILAQKAGITLPSFEPKIKEEKQKNQEINEVVTSFFESELQKNKEALQYLIDRQVSKDIIQKFRIGWASDSYDSTHLYLQKQGFSQTEILAAGLAGQSETVGKNMYDRFRGRIIFPIKNVMGNVIAFGGRILKKETETAKYLNSPDTALYNKSLVLFALDLAKKSIKEQGCAVIVEGYMDVVASHQAGVTHVVASSGTAFTVEQAKILQRYTKTLLFAFDSDMAGRAATKRAIEGTISTGLEVKIIQIEGEKDPDECIQKDPNIWKTALKNPLSVMDFYFSEAKKSFDASTVEGKKAISEMILPLIQKFPSHIEQSEYIARLSSCIRVDQKILWKEFVQIPSSSISKRVQKIPTKTMGMNIDSSAYLLGVIIASPSLFEVVLQKLIFQILPEDKRKKFYKLLKDVYNREGGCFREGWEDELSEEEREEMNLWTLYVESKNESIQEKDQEKEIDQLIIRLNKKNLAEKQKQLRFDLDMSKNNPEQYKILLNQYNETIKLSSTLT